MRFSQAGRQAAVITIMLATTVAMLPRTSLMLGSSLSERDGKLVFLPYLQFVAESFRNGVYPLWTTLVQNGFPIHEDGLLGFFYPDTLLLFALPPALMWNVSVVLHLILAGVGTFCLCRRLGHTYTAALLAGIVYLAASHKAGYAMQGLSSLRSCSLLPMVLLQAENYFTGHRSRATLILGILFGLQVLSGHPLPVVMTFYAFMLFFVLRARHLYLRDSGSSLAPQVGRHLLRLAAIGTIAIGMSAIQLLPMLELSALSVRGGGLSYGHASVGSLMPLNLISVAFPHWAQLQETPLYVGVFTVLLAFLSFRMAFPGSGKSTPDTSQTEADPRLFYCRYFLLLAAVATFLALGKFNVVDPVLRTVLPGLRYLRMSERFLVVTTLSLAVLAGYGLDHLREALRSRGDSLRSLRTVVLVATSLSLIGIGLASFGSTVWRSDIVAMGKEYVRKYIHNRPPHRYTLDYYDLKVERLFDQVAQTLSWDNPANLLSLLFLVASITILWALKRPERSCRWVAAFLVAFVFLDLLVHSHTRSVDPPASMLTPERTETEAFLSSQSGFFRVYRVMGDDYNPNFSSDHDSYLEIPENYNMVSGIRSVGINTGLVTRDYDEYLGPLGATLNRGYGWGTVTVEKVLQHLDLLSALSVRYVLSSQDIVHPTLRLVRGGRTRIYENVEALPRALVVHGFRIESDPLGIIHSDAFRPREEVILPNTVGAAWSRRSAPPSPTASSAVDFVDAEESRIVMDVEMGERGFLVLNDLYYPGWRATVNGVEVEILKANHTMRALVLEEGSHEVRFTYAPPWFSAGAGITLSTLSGFCLIGLVLAGRRVRSQ
jgi:hypothetical protein